MFPKNAALDNYETISLISI